MFPFLIKPQLKSDTEVTVQRYREKCVQFGKAIFINEQADIVQYPNTVIQETILTMAELENKRCEKKQEID